MKHISRIDLKPGNCIHLSWSPNYENMSDWKIHSVIGKGISTICYSAECDGIKGRLKEFYPNAAAFMERNISDCLYRNSSLQLVPKNDIMAKRFDAMCKDVVNAYEMLDRARDALQEDELLKNSIPEYKIVYGCSDNMSKRASIYIWTPDERNGKGFDVYLSEVRNDPEKRPVHKLYNIIHTVIALSRFIKALHVTGLLHLDIKPSNFLVSYNDDFDINTASISLMDINTIYPIGCSFPIVSGTEAYRAPEVNQGRAEIRSDIYSIGALLFNAIVIVKGMKDGLYKEEYYDYIEQMTASSALANAADPNANIFLQSKLAQVLKNCLAHDVSERYSSCDELIEALGEAQSLLLAGTVDADAENKQISVQIEEEEQAGISSPTAIMQNLLFNNPLPISKWQPELSQHINILVLGTGTYGQKFIDLCLEVGQLPKHEVRIKAISNNPEHDREVYLQFRPALTQFVSVNGKYTHPSRECYGTVEFLSLTGDDENNQDIVSFSSNDLEFNRNIVEKIILNTSEEKEPFQYVFIALGDDALNKTIADLCVETLTIIQSDDSHVPCSVNFAVRDSKYVGASKANAVCITDRITADTINSELYRMAFNTHLSWNSTLNVNMDEEQKRFNERYNFESSLAFAISIRYKLACLGIGNAHSTDDNLMEMAASFKDKIANKKLLAELSAYEHRRWVVEKLVNGWQAPLDKDGNIDYEQCVQMGRMLNKTNDPVKKLHPCIVRSTEEMPLQSNAYKKYNHKKWNESDIEDSLDELDRMSLCLHRSFRKHADIFRAKQPLHHGDLEMIQNEIADADNEVTYAYKRFELCLKRILNGSERYSRQYGYYSRSFEDSLHTLPESVQHDIRSRLGNLQRDFFPVIESNRYRDYKDNDAILIRNIPFIMTFKPQPTLAMAFDDGRMHSGRNDEIFRNVASAMILNPGRITYLYCFDANSRTAFFIQKLSSVLSYLNSRRMNTHIGIRIALIVSENVKNNPEKDTLRIKDLESKVKEIGITDVVIKTVSSEELAVSSLLEALSYEKFDLYDGSTTLFSSHYYNHAFIDAIDKKGYSYFEFYSPCKKFRVCRKCDYLNYVKDSSFIRIDDMFALRQAKDQKFNLPEFASDYKILWKIYTGEHLNQGENNFEYGVTNWTRMCTILNQEDYVKFFLSAEAQDSTVPIICNLPDHCYKACDQLVRQLKTLGAINIDSNVSTIASDTCRVEIYTKWRIKDKLERVFSRPEKLIDPRLVRVESNRDEGNLCIKVEFDNLDVRSLYMAAQDVTWEYSRAFVYPLLKKLEEKGFIRNLCWDGGNKESRKINFSYSSPRIKQLLTKAGEILEIYVYYEVLKTGYFDDIASGYEFQWGYGGVENELDCVMTKGFRSLIVECKAKKIIDQKDYHTFNNLAEQFGIGCTKVIVANTYAPRFAEANKKQINRGEQLNIITISKKEDIVNIGDTLVRIMEGKFN